MNFVDKQQCPLTAGRNQIAGFIQDLTQFFHPAGHRAKLSKPAPARRGE
jgi:hypothetical protein